MMDRELLELAAKAAGFDAWWSEPFKMILLRSDGNRAWQPLENDGDALRLAVSVGIDINFSDQIGSRVAANGLAEKFVDHVSATAATRRAIVRAAAEIGKQMP